MASITVVNLQSRGLPTYELPEIAGINYPKIGCLLVGLHLVVSTVFLSSFFEQM